MGERLMATYNFEGSTREFDSDEDFAKYLMKRRGFDDSVSAIKYAKSKKIQEKPSTPINSQEILDWGKMELAKSLRDKANMEYSKSEDPVLTSLFPHVVKE
jgi:hypothetical protein